MDGNQLTASHFWQKSPLQVRSGRLQRKRPAKADRLRRSVFRVRGRYTPSGDVGRLSRGNGVYRAMRPRMGRFCRLSEV